MIRFVVLIEFDKFSLKSLLKYVHNVGRPIIIQGNKKKWVNILNSVQKATDFKKSKMEMNEMCSYCEDIYRPVIIDFVQYQHSSVQLDLTRKERKEKVDSTTEF